ncbi:MAG TPA: hypothetical protein VEG30_06410 [Terriglobales bacterium]|nr:hypothetical protein [Terriglobales bacterium]
MPSREIVEDQLFKDQINKYRISWKRLDEALMSLDPALRGSPELFPIVPGTQLRRLKLVGFPGVPPLSIFFTLSETQIVIKTAELIDLEE